MNSRGLKDIQSKNRRIFFSTYKKAFRYIAEYKKQLSILIVIITLGVSVSSVIPYLYGIIIDSFADKDLSRMGILIGIYFLLSMLVTVLSIIENGLAVRTGEKIQCNLKSNLYKRVVCMKAEELEKYSVGELISRIESDLNAVISFNIDFLSSIMFIFLNFCVPFVLIFTISTQLSFLAIIFLPASSAVYFVFKRRMRKVEQLQKEYGDDYYAYMNHTLYNLIAIKSFQFEKNVIERFRAFMDKAYSITKQKARVNNNISFWNQSINGLLSALLLLFAAFQINDGTLTIGLLVSFNIYVSKLFDSISSLQKLKFNEQQLSVSLERLSVLETVPQENSFSTGYSGSSIIGQGQTISIQNLSYSFSDNHVLNNVNIDIQEPGLYSIIGKNGSGKTTLLRLLLKFYDLQQGSVTLDRIPYSELSEYDIRCIIGYIQKEPFILNDSIFENIRMGSTITEEVAWELCKQVGLSDSINSLEKGIHTYLGEGGLPLSSGMKQKLSIARALAQDSQILILDEFTSDLDGISEQQITAVIEDYAKEHLVISVSHRHYTVNKSKCIFVLDGGSVVDMGKYVELSSRCEAFQLLFPDMPT